MKKLSELSNIAGNALSARRRGMHRGDSQLQVYQPVSSQRPAFSPTAKSQVRPNYSIKKLALLWVFGVGMASVWTGCKASEQPDPGAESSAAEKSGKSGADWAADCDPAAPLNDAPAEPGVVRGRVLAPDGKLALHMVPGTMGNRPGGHHGGVEGKIQGLKTVRGVVARAGGFLVGVAHASPLDGELPVAHAHVELYRVGADGNRVGETLQATQTNSIGEWCLLLPDDLEFGADLMLEARAKKDSGDGEAGEITRLRRSLVADFAADHDAGTEALTRYLQAEKVDFTRISPEIYLNMASIADSRMDLLSPVKLRPGATIEGVVGEILEALQEDPRLEEKVSGLTRISGDEPR